MPKSLSLRLKPKNSKPTQPRTHKSKGVVKHNKSKPQSATKMWQYGGAGETEYYLLMTTEDLNSETEEAKQEKILNKLFSNEAERKNYDVKTVEIKSNANIDDEVKIFNDLDALKANVKDINVENSDKMVYLGKDKENKIYAVMKGDGDAVTEIELKLDTRSDNLGKEYTGFQKAGTTVTVAETENAGAGAGAETETENAGTVTENLKAEDEAGAGAKNTETTTNPEGGEE